MAGRAGFRNSIWHTMMPMSRSEVESNNEPDGEACRHRHRDTVPAQSAPWPTTAIIRSPDARSTCHALAEAPPQATADYPCPVRGTDCPASACRCRRCACAGRHQQRRPDAGGHDGLAGDAQRLFEEIPWFAPQARVRLLPDWETLPYDSFSPHHDLVSGTSRHALYGDARRLRHPPAAASTALYRMAPPSGWRHGPSSSSRANGSTPTR